MEEALPLNGGQFPPGRGTDQPRQLPIRKAFDSKDGVETKPSA